MRKRYRQKADGTLEFVGLIKTAPYAANTFAVGDIPDMMKDVEKRKTDNARKDKQERLNTIVDIVNRSY